MKHANNNIIEDIIKTFWADTYEIVIVDVHRLIEAASRREPQFECLLQCNTTQKAIPILAYGFESLGYLKRVHGDELLDMTNYLQLPSTLNEIQQILSIISIQNQKPLNDKASKSYMIRQVRDFRHRFDNYWMVLSLHANRAKKDEQVDPENLPPSLNEFTTKMLRERLDEYEKIKIYVERLSLPGRQRIPIIFNELNDQLSSIVSKDTQSAILIAFSCVEKFKEISKILSKAKEIH